jgi:hypothetical protein
MEEENMQLLLLQLHHQHHHSETQMPPISAPSPSVCTPSIRRHVDPRNSNNVISWVISSFWHCNGDDGSTLEKQLRCNTQ